MTAPRRGRRRRRPVSSLARVLLGGIPHQAVHRVSWSRHLQLLLHGNIVLAGDHRRRGDVPQTAATDAQSRSHIASESLCRVPPQTCHRRFLRQSGAQAGFVQQRTDPESLSPTAAPLFSWLSTPQDAQSGKIFQLQTRISSVPQEKSRARQTRRTTDGVVQFRIETAQVANTLRKGDTSDVRERSDEFMYIKKRETFLSFY